MKVLSRWASRAFAITLFAGSLGIGVAIAQTQENLATQASFTTEYEGRITLRADHTATNVFTTRTKILSPSVIQAAGQQQLNYIEGMETLETVEAFTETADGKRIPVEPTNIITRDAASGLQATYLRDLKQRTIIFSNVTVGSTLVMTHKKETLKGLFPGNFTYYALFARSKGFTSSRITIEIPMESDVRVDVVGQGISHTVEESAGFRRHEVVVNPEPFAVEETGAVAALDRDPAVFVSTFRSYEEMGLAYRQGAFPKAEVTPEILSLANEITKDLDKKIAQAQAIDSWMKKNIRYVAVYLSLGRVVPNDAAAVLKNKFGDCKDKVTLMSALLAAKGITSEQVLISSGNGYKLHDPPTMAALNHVILYLPDFDLYDDPSANQAAFGVLSPGTYDKPVIHISEAGAKLARTPVMKIEDHTVETKTTINIAADGSIAGQTEERAKGVFGMGLRAAAAVVQNVGNETAAQRQLQSYNTPGKGRFDLGNFVDTADPLVVRSVFTLKNLFKSPSPNGRAEIPMGLPLLVRPGNFFFGSRLSGRKSPYVCYAGKQTEDIEVNFAEGLPLPIPLKTRDINAEAFTYRSVFAVENRTLRIHREFTSRVPQQICTPELEARISEDLDTVRINVNTTYPFGAAAPVSGVATNPASTIEFTRTAASGQKLQLEFLSSLNPDCSSLGPTHVRIVEEPKHGNVVSGKDMGFSNFPADNPRYDCNKMKTEGVAIYYESNPQYVGSDVLIIEAIFPSGNYSRVRYSIDVR